VLAHTLLVLGGACSLARPHQPHLWFGCHRVPKGNKARDSLAGSLIVKTAGTRERSRRLARRHTGDPLVRGDDLGLSIELPDQELDPCERLLVRGSNED
jgi:hypothetical protein